MPATASERMSRVDTAWLRMDNDVNLMMIVGVWLLQPAHRRYEALCERVERQAAEVRALSPEGGAGRDRRALGATTTTSTSTATWCARSSCASAGQSEREALQARVGELATHAARPGAPAVAVPPDRALRRRQRADRAHPPLHRRRHRADLGDDVDHRRRHRPAAAQAHAAPRRRADGDWLVRRGDQAADRPGGQGDRHVRRRRRQARWRCCRTRSRPARLAARWRASAARCWATSPRWR